MGQQVLYYGDSGQLLSHRFKIPREVPGIARRSSPINVIVYYPKTQEGQHELARRVAGVHADMVNQYIKKLNCPSEQKVRLLDAVIRSASIGESR